MDMPILPVGIVYDVYVRHMTHQNAWAYAIT